MTDIQRLRDDIVDLERRFWLEGGGDPAFWQRHCHDDAVILLPLGIMDKAQTVAAMEQADGWASVDLEGVRAVPLNHDCVSIAYRASARHPDGSGYSAIIGSVYIRTGSAWQLAFHQQTPQASALS